MASDSTNLTPPSGDDNPYDRKHHLRVIPTPDIAAELSSAAVDPAGMGSQDVASLLRLEQPPPVPPVANEPGSQLSDPTVLDDDDAAATYDRVDGGHATGASHGVQAPPSSDQLDEDLGDFELRYADGTATPTKHGILRRRNLSQGSDHEKRGRAVLAERGAGPRAAHQDDEQGVGPPEAEAPSRELAQQPADISSKPTNGRRLKPLTVLTAALLLVGIVPVAGLIGESHGEPKATQTVVQTVTTPVTVTQTTAAKTSTRPKHVKKHRVVKHTTTKPKTTVTTPATSTTASHVTTSQSTYTAPAYTAPAYTQPAQPSRSVSSKSGSGTTGSSTSKSSSSSKSSSTGGSLSAGQQAALNPS